ncbi:MAG TPA: ABC transporter substrate-binding protein, partial [Verrucomicrobiae bacterium]|nr:ABC transporter substrate-binding protein [Verrucomicrobiae bacterium]
TKRTPAIALLLWAGAGFFAFSGCTAKIEPPLRVGAIVWTGYEPLFLARTLGKFDETAIKLVEYPNTPEVIRSFQNGAIEVAAMTGDEFLRLAADDPDVRIVLFIDFSRGADALVATPQFDCVKELKRHRIGVEVNSPGVFLLARALESASMTARDVEVVPIENDQHVSEFKGGKVDAVITFEPHRSKLLQAGGHVLFDSAQIPGEIVDFLVVRKSLIETRRKSLEMLIRAWFEAREYLIAERKSACAKMALREQVSPAEMEKSLSLIEIPSLEKNRELLVTARQKTYENFKAMHQEMLRSGISSGALPEIASLEGGLLP